MAKIEPKHEAACESCGRIFMAFRRQRYCSLNCRPQSVRLSDREYFDSHYTPEPNTGCWLWTGHVTRGSRHGYGMSHRWTGSGVRQKFAHRMAWELEHGPIPEGLCVLHSCIGTRSCVNPAHMRLGTHADNTADKMRQGRHPRQGPRNPARGERSSKAKLTAELVRQIRAECVRTHGGGGVRRANSASDWARRLGVAPDTISRVLNRLTWRHVA